MPQNSFLFQCVERVVVALGALKLHAQEHPAGVVGRPVGGVVVPVIEDRGVLVLVPGRDEDVVGDAVEGGALVEPLRQPADEGGRVLPAPGLIGEQQASPGFSLELAEAPVGEQLFDQLAALVGAGVVQEGGRLLHRRDNADQVEIEAAQELPVLGRRRDGQAVLRQPAADLFIEDPGELQDAQLQGWTDGLRLLGL
jgi:hypothetical protein